MSNRIARAAFALAAVCAGVSLAYAATPTFWQVSNQAEFAKGDVENLSIDSFGRLTLGPAATSIYETSAPFLWSMVSGPDGALYVGSGNEGQVYRIDASGKGSVYFDAEEIEVHALAVAPGGVLYAGTSPDGKIYKIDAMGRSSVFYDPPDKYIWGLAVDKAGNVFAATGDKGVVYKITPDGKGAVFYQTKATHAISLAIESDGHLLVGTESPGRLFRLDATGKPFVLLDSPYNEIHALRIDPKGVIYAAAVSGTTSGSGVSVTTPNPEPAPPSTPTVSVSTEITAIVVDAGAAAGVGGSTSGADRTNNGPSAGGVYRITPDGAWDLIWNSRDDSPYDIAFEPDGAVLIATGNKGKIYRLAGDPLQPTLLTRAMAQQVTALLRDSDGRVSFTTSNPGKVSRLSSARAERGTYTSDVRDAQTIATWGAIRWQAQVPAGTRLEIATRSGNTRTPDETWSDWTAAYSAQEGSAIASPRARYLQWRATLIGSRSDAPLLTSVTAAYLPRNTRPEVTSITINPPGTVYQRPFPTGDPEIAGFDGDLPDKRNNPQQGNPGGPSLGRRTYQKGLLTFVWRAQDENRDELVYDAFYRREGDTAWKPLKHGLTDEIVVWDTSSVPNGRYVLRVVASDAPSNSPSTALTGSLESTAFDIDNTPPVITVTNVTRQGGKMTIAFEVRDADSNVQKAEYSLDGDRWQTIYPKDGIPDSRMEQFELVLDGEPGTHGVIIRATDALNNIASARGDVQPQPAPVSGRR
jgi:sugar lactone lactonase YvrE